LAKKQGVDEPELLNLAQLKKTQGEGQTDPKSELCDMY